MDRGVPGAVRARRADASVAVTPGSRHLPGRWWPATDGGYVGYEPWLEHDNVMLLDFDPAVHRLAAVLGVLNRDGWPVTKSAIFGCTALSCT